MGIINRHIKTDDGYSGLSNHVLNQMADIIVSAKASATNAVYTVGSAFSAATLNSTVAPGTGVDFPRNLVYQLSVIGGTASSAIISGGSIIARGSDIRGSAISETIAGTALAAASVAVQGSACFGSLGTISFSNWSLHTGSSTNSSCVSFSVGLGNLIGLPQSFRGQNGAGTGVAPYAWIGTAIQPGSYTFITGSDIPFAGVSFSNNLASNTPARVAYWQTA